MSTPSSHHLQLPACPTAQPPHFISILFLTTTFLIFLLFLTTFFLFFVYLIVSLLLPISGVFQESKLWLNLLEHC